MFSPAILLHQFLDLFGYSLLTTHLRRIIPFQVPSMCIKWVQSVKRFVAALCVMKKQPQNRNRAWKVKLITYLKTRVVTCLNLWRIAGKTTLHRKKILLFSRRRACYAGFKFSANICLRYFCRLKVNPSNLFFLQEIENKMLKRNRN